MRRVVSRRAVLRFGVVAGLVSGCGYSGPERTVRIAAGEVGGFYVEFARLLAREIGGAVPGLRAEVLETTGTVANIAKLSEGQADLALGLLDVLAAARVGGAPFSQALPLHALGRVYENYMQLVVLAGSPVRTLDELSGLRVSLGADGSGAATFGERLLTVAGLRVRADHRPLAAAITALREREVDALLWSGGVPTPALAELHAQAGIRLLDLGGQVKALRAAYGPAYNEVAVPAGSYGASSDVMTVGVSNLLVPAANLPDDVVRAVVRVLSERSASLVPQQALGAQYLDVRSLINTGSVPLHTAAAETYRELRG